MPQHDGVLDNQAGAAFRADLNNFILAIIANSSGATAPATTYAYQWWADTTTGLLKIRNAANSAWITVGTLASANLGLLPLAGGTLTGLLRFFKGANIASATTVDLTAATGNLVHITGTTPTTGLTMNSGQAVWLIADGAWPLTYHATNLKLNSGGVDKTLATGDMVLCWYDGTTKYAYIIKADGTAVISAAPSGSIKQVVNTETGAVATGTTVLPFDDTIPQNTEGDQYMSLAITPSNALSTLLIDVVFWGSCSVQDELIAALFQDTTADAIGAISGTPFTATARLCLAFRHKMTAGTTSATTFKVRAGMNSAGTTTFNGHTAARKLGGVGASSITITEVLP